jgi:hypothetical protein
LAVVAEEIGRRQSWGQCYDHFFGAFERFSAKKWAISWKPIYYYFGP